MTLNGTEGMLQRTVLIPYMDFLNHDSQTFNAALQVIEIKAYDKSFYALVATRHISKGVELLIRYGVGDESSLELYQVWIYSSRQRRKRQGTLGRFGGELEQ
jgi:hypothetical protein